VATQELGSIHDPEAIQQGEIVYSAPTFLSATSAREAEAEAPRFEALIGEAVVEAERG
jgi:hypothetical protein